MVVEHFLCVPYLWHLYSSNVCKMVAVGLGWDKAFGKVDEMGSIDERHKGWIEIEEKGRIVPVWTAFELF